MKKIIYSNIIYWAGLILLPWYVANQEYYWNILSFDSNYLFYFALSCAVCLSLIDVVIGIRSKGQTRKTALWCGLPSFLLVAFFVLAYFFAFSGFTGF